ncbi:MAG: M50 family metallopeptidase [Armatimonadetes bacterium]|nr:M50 family metallopeptidase [Armatimonadota bacterium]
MALRKDQSLLIWASVASLAVWAVPFLRPVLLPLIYYNTHIHELCHALAAVVTGGSVEHIKVFASGGGETITRGGSPFLLATSGYVGSAIVGGLLIYGARTVAGARKMLWVAAGFIALTMVFFVRGETVGVLAGLGWLAALVAMAVWLKGDAKIFAVQFLGIQQCLTSVYAFLTLLAITASSRGHSDATNMEQATHLPAMFWAVVWLLIALAAMGFGIKASWANRPR